MKRGDHIYVRRLAYEHHGIYVGDDQVVHFSGETKSRAAILQTSLATFARGLPVEVMEYGIRLEAEDTVARAESRLGTSGYLLLWNNCEHFARWCATGKHQSAQIGRRVSDAGITVASLGGRTAVVSSTSSFGLLTGGSGPSLMSGLAAIGPGGAVGGLLTLAAGPTIVGGLAMRAKLRDDECLPKGERRARRLGRWGAVGGCLALGALAFGGLYFLGVVGLSGAGITSGLAAIGRLIGMGMRAGIVMLTLAPLVGMLIGGFVMRSLSRVVA